VFAPFYIDSAFDGSSYRFDKTFPKFLNPGVEFYQGIQWALDSLQKKGAPLEVFIYDSRSQKIPLAQRLNGADLNGVQLLIAHANSNDVKILAVEAQRRKIPFISATFPNDAGVTNNPYFVVLNSTLRTHCEGIYQYLQKYHSQDKIILFRKNGSQESQIRDYFNDAAKTSTSNPLKIEMVDIGNSFDVGVLANRLDSTKRNICIAGSLDENFGRRLAQQLASIDKSYPVTLVGMPTFDNLTKDFTLPQYKGLEIVYSTPFYNSRMDKVSQGITDYFNTKMYARPSDMVMRGYEATWRFSKLLLQYGKDIASNLSRKEFNVFRELDIQPVISKETTTLDYFENKKLFFVKWQDGIIKGVN